MKILAIRKREDIDVQFMDNVGFVKKHVNYQSFKLGQVKNPYDKTIFGVACFGVGKHMARKNGKLSHIYFAWTSMLDRCYGKQEKHPAYNGKCHVCDEWLNFQNFADWYSKSEYPVNERLHVDKDILYPGNTLYSPDRCILVPQRINMLFMINTMKCNGIPQGIREYKSGKYNSSYRGQSLGTYCSLEEAFAAYKEEKEKTIKKVANEYKSIIPKSLYEVLIKYEVTMENSTNYRKVS